MKLSEALAAAAKKTEHQREFLRQALKKPEQTVVKTEPRKPAPQRATAQR